MSQNTGGMHLRLVDQSAVTHKANDARKLVGWVDSLWNDASVCYWKTDKREGPISGWETAPEPDSDPQGRYR